MFNEYRRRVEGKGWCRSTEGVCANSKNNLIKDEHNNFHTLQFQYTVKSLDTVYFALTLPYTLSKLLTFSNEYSSQFSTLSYTFCGNPILIYQTGNLSSSKSILITARQHPS